MPTIKQLKLNGYVAIEKRTKLSTIRNTILHKIENSFLKKLEYISSHFASLDNMNYRIYNKYDCYIMVSHKFDRIVILKKIGEYEE